MNIYNLCFKYTMAISVLIIYNYRHTTCLVDSKENLISLKIRRFDSMTWFEKFLCVSMGLSYKLNLKSFCCLVPFLPLQFRKTFLLFCFYILDTKVWRRQCRSHYFIQDLGNFYFISVIWLIVVTLDQLTLLAAML